MTVARRRKSHRGAAGRAARRRREVLGILMAATGVFLLLALWPWDPAIDRSVATLNRVGILGSYTAYYLYRVLGLAALFVGGALVAWGALIVLDRVNRRAALVTLAVAGAGILVVTLLGVGAAWSGEEAGWAERAGTLGTRAGLALIGVIGVAGAVLACTVGLVLLAAATFRLSLAGGVHVGVSLSRVGGRKARAGLGGLAARWRARRERIALAAEPVPTPDTDIVSPSPPAAETAPISPPARRSRSLRTESTTRPAHRGEVPPSFIPPLELLDPAPRGEAIQEQSDLERLGDVLIEKLRTFNVEGEVVAIHSGPVLTQFEVKPAAGVKVNQIANLADDLALAMKAQRIRIVAPIPGKGVVGIEIPNRTRHTVTIREMLEAREWVEFQGKIPLALGREIAGVPIVADLARMPHLLIAGATGSGKSVCINSIVTSLLYRFAPDEVRLIMIDPKMLELIAYNGVPHLLHPVVVEHRESAKALKWTVAEMERRYRVLAANGVRSLQDFNTRIRAGEELEGLEGDQVGRTIPTVVVLIDELADLMLTVQNEIEEPLARLAQMARAVGIHLVLATQRPSVNVITGVIKANFPSRLSFQVSSKIDSRTVLDMNGAEQLLGHGDMLYLPADRAEPIRIQGAHVSTAETTRVVDWLKAAGEALGAAEVAPPVDIIAEASELEMAALDERDELFFQAARVVVEHDQGSTSLLQRRLKVGYSRAARILDQLEQAGIVGPPEGTRPREVRVTLDELEALEAGAL